jgi:hypothetical protein
MVTAPPFLKSLSAARFSFPSRLQQHRPCQRKMAWRDELPRPNSLPAPDVPGGKNRGLSHLIYKTYSSPQFGQRQITPKMEMAQRRNASEPNLLSGRSTIGTKNQGSLKIITTDLYRKI